MKMNESGSGRAGYGQQDFMSSSAYELIVFFVGRDNSDRSFRG